jgi:hypothetical protein
MKWRKKAEGEQLDRAKWSEISKKATQRGKKNYQIAKIEAEEN